MPRIYKLSSAIVLAILLSGCAAQGNSVSESASSSENSASEGTTSQEETLSASYVDGYNTIINSNYSDLAAAGYASVYGPDGNTPDRVNAEKFCTNIMDMAVLSGSAFSEAEYSDEVAGCTDAVMDKG